MRRLFLALAAALATLAAPASATVVQHNTGQSAGNGCAWTTTFTSAPTAGDYLLAIVGGPYINTTTTAPDASWVLVEHVSQPSVMQYDVWEHVAKAGDGTAYTFKPVNCGNGYPGYSWLVYELSGVNGIDALTSSVITTAQANTTSGPLTPSVLHDLPFAISTNGAGDQSHDSVDSSSAAGCTLEDSNTIGTGGAFLEIATAACSLTANTTSPVSVVWDYNGGTNHGLSLDSLLLFAPAGTAPTLTLGTMPQGTVGTPYSTALPITGGTPPYTCTNTSGLPPGLTLTGCTVAGTPSTAASYSPSITVTDSSPNPQGSKTQAVPITIVPEPPVVIGTTSIAGNVNQYLSTSYGVSGGHPPYACTTTGTLPAGLVNSGIGNQGVVSPGIGPTTQGTSSVSVTCTDASSPQLTDTKTVGFSIGAAAAPLAVSAFSGISTGDFGDFHGAVMSPSDAYHARIDTAAVDALSASKMSAVSGIHMHPDNTMPYTVVDSVAQAIPLQYVAVTPIPSNLSKSQNDATMQPVYHGILEEGNPGTCWTGTSSPGDHHAFVIDKATAALYENYQLVECNGAYSTAFATVWDMTRTERRPYAFSSTDAAGLSVFEGTIRYDEIVAGVITHATRFTMAHTLCTNSVRDGAYTNAWVFPATHGACNNGSATNMAAGTRLRLKASFDVSSFSATVQIILNSWKKYGLILADNGSNFFFQLTPDPRWQTSDLNAFVNVVSDNLEMVQTGTVYDDHDYPAPVPPVINSVTVSPATVAAGGTATITADVTGASYLFTDYGGYFSPANCSSPSAGRNICSQTITAAQANTTYTLTATNQSLGGDGQSLASDDQSGDGGRPNQPVTLYVTGGAPPPVVPIKLPFVWGQP